MSKMLNDELQGNAMPDGIQDDAIGKLLFGLEGKGIEMKAGSRAILPDGYYGN